MILADVNDFISSHDGSLQEESERKIYKAILGRFPNF